MKRSSLVRPAPRRWRRQRGGITLLLSQWIVPDRLYPWLDLAGATGEPAQESEPVLEIREERLPVRPRVLSGEAGESVPLEDELGPILAKHERGAIRLVGPAGSGKSTALAHLARRLPAHFGVASARARALYAIATGTARVVVASTAALMPRVSSPARLQGALGLDQQWKGSPVARVIGTGVSEFVRGVQSLGVNASDPAELELLVDGASRSMDRTKERELANRVHAGHRAEQRLPVQ